MSARTIGAGAVVALPLTIILADYLRISAERGATGDGTTQESVISQFASIEANRGTFEAASWLFYAAALLTIPMVLLLWRLAVDRAPRWAWAGGVLGALAVTGQIAHLMGYFAPYQAFSTIDHTLGAQAQLAFEDNMFAMAVFMPFLIGLFLFPPVLAVALWRARVVPTWAMGAVVIGAVAYLVLAGPWWVTVVWGVALLVGFAPAVRLALRGGASPTVPVVAPVGASA